MVPCIMAVLRTQDTIREKKIDLSPGICSSFLLCVLCCMSSHFFCLPIHRQTETETERENEPKYKLSDPRRMDAKI